MTTIYIKKADLAVLWRVSAPRVSQIAAHLAYRDDGVDLVEALTFRPTTVGEDVFEDVVSKCWTDDGTSALEEAQSSMLFALYSAEDEHRPAGDEERDFTRLDNAPPADRGPAKPTPSRQSQDDNAALNFQERMQQLRLQKVQAEIDARDVKLRKELGELIERAQVERDLTTAGTLMKNGLLTLGQKLVMLVPSEEREAAQDLIDDTITRALFALAESLRGIGIITEIKND